MTENGPGIDVAYKGKGFKLRQTLGKTNRLSKKGMGLGMVRLHAPSIQFLFSILKNPGFIKYTENLFRCTEPLIMAISCRPVLPNFFIKT